MEVVNALGRRKSAIARIFVSEGTGKITQGRGYRIRKRSNHVTLFVGSKSNNEDQN